MSQFRCIGTFGPYCPTVLPSTTPGFSPYVRAGNLRLVAQSVAEQMSPQQQLSVFPTELAMKIFWEADTINMTASVTTQYLALGSVTGTCNRTIVWGSYDVNVPGFQNLNDLRQGVETAAEMLCHISDECSLPGAATFPTHTLFREITDQGFKPWSDPNSPVCLANPASCKWSTSEQMLIAPRLAIDGTDRLNLKKPPPYAPFDFYLENSGIISANNGVYISAYEPERPNQGGNSTKLVGAANFVTPWGSWAVNMAGGLNVTDASMTITVTASDKNRRYGVPRI